MVSKKNDILIERLPILCMLIVWVPQFIYRIFYKDRLFYQFDKTIYLLMALTVLAFILGSTSSKFLLNLFSKKNNIRSIKASENLSINKYRLILVFLLTVSFFFIYNNLIGKYISGISIDVARDATLENWASGGFVVKLNAVIINLTIAMLISSIITFYVRTKKIPLIQITTFILLTIAAYSRTHVLIGLTIIIISIIRVHDTPIKVIFQGSVFFIILFLLLSILTKDNSKSTLGSLEIALNQLEIYFFGGVSGFDFFYSMQFPRYNTMLTIPKIIQTILPFSMDLPPSYYEFVDTTPVINVFSAMYPPFHDFGILGLLLFFFGYGFITTTACIKYNKNNSLIWLIASGFLIYCTIMSVFDDQFIRGTPVFLMFTVGGALYEYLVTYRINKADNNAM